jgi:hypothetical protein
LIKKRRINFAPEAGQNFTASGNAFHGIGASFLQPLAEVKEFILSPWRTVANTDTWVVS